jgi:hypothetical protein
MGGVPASTGGGGGVIGGAQVPTVDPGGVWQTLPAQQSALIVQPPLEGTQGGPASGTLRQRSCPVLSGTQGAPLQQSPENAQVSPDGRHPVARHRGTPSWSSWQAPELPGAPQQSLGADDTTQAYFISCL